MLLRHFGTGLGFLMDVFVLGVNQIPGIRHRNRLPGNMCGTVTACTFMAAPREHNVLAHTSVDFGSVLVCACLLDMFRLSMQAAAVIHSFGDCH